MESARLVFNPQEGSLWWLDSTEQIAAPLTIAEAARWAATFSPNDQALPATEIVAMSLGYLNQTATARGLDRLAALLSETASLAGTVQNGPPDAARHKRLTALLFVAREQARDDGQRDFVHHITHALGVLAGDDS